MIDFLLPYLILFVPFLLLLYMAVEIYLRNPKRTLHRLTGLIILTYSFMFFGDYLMQVLQVDLAPLALRYIKYAAVFTNLTAGLYFVQFICKFQIRPIVLHTSSLLPLVGIYYLLSGSSWFNISVHGGPIWRWEEKSNELELILFATTVYTIVTTIAFLMLADRRLKSKPWMIQERNRIRVILKAAVWMLAWISIFQLLLKPLPWTNPYLQFDLITSYGVFIFCFSIRYAMVNYDFLSTAGKRYEILFQDSKDGIVIFDETWRHMDANPAYLQMIGIKDQTDKSWRNANYTDFISLEGNLMTEEQIFQAKLDRKSFQVETRLTNRMGQSFDIEAHIHLFEMERQFCWFVIVKDITEQKISQKKLAYLAYHDPLTRLNNRRRFYEDLVHELLRMDQTDCMLAVVLIDLDQFKWINDTLGHYAGDELLILVTERLKSVVPANGCVARMGGDEFVVMMPGLHSDYEVEELAREIINELRKPFTINSRQLRVTASVGISVAPRDGTDAEAIVMSADTAMYAAKKAGRDQFMKYLPTQMQAAEQALVLVNGLRTAMENDEFALHYQPQIELLTGRMIGVEALLRWNSAELGLISPAEFIPIAEETGAIVPIGDWVLHTAIMQGKKWIDLGHSDMVVSVNLSALQLIDPQLSIRLANILQEHDYPASNLCLEITESTAIGNLEETLLVCGEIDELGVSLSIDDFGTGYSSLGMLSRFPFRTVKIDKSLISDIERNRKDAAIIQTIVQLSSHLEMDVVAEGVETEAQLTILKDFGCHQIQGYLCGRPMPSEDIDKILEQRTKVESA